MTTPHEITLRLISSASPSIFHAGDQTREHSCTTCRLLIDEARDALGFAHWPAVPYTPKGNNDHE